jgi:hypothetical protein
VGSKGEPATEILHDNLVMRNNLASFSDNVGETNFAFADTGLLQPRMHVYVREGLFLNDSARSDQTSQTGLENKHTPAIKPKLRMNKMTKWKDCVRRSDTAGKLQLLDHC